MVRASQWWFAGVSAALACAVQAAAAPPIPPPTPAEIAEANALFAGDADDAAALETAMAEFRGQRERMCAALDRAFDSGDEAHMRASVLLALESERKALPKLFIDRAARLARNAPFDVVAVNFASPARARAFLRDAGNADDSASLDAGAPIDRWSARTAQLMHALQCADVARALDVVGALQETWPLTEPNVAVVVSAHVAIERLRETATIATWAACIDACAALDPSRRFELARLEIAWNTFDRAQSADERALALDSVVRIATPEVATAFGEIARRTTNGAEWADAQRVRSSEARALQLIRIADAKRDSGSGGQAELIYAHVSDRFAGTDRWVRATANSGELLREMGRPQAAIERMERIFAPDALTDVEAGTDSRWNRSARRGAAVEISRAHEDLSRLEDALEWLKKARQFPSGADCSICIDGADRRLDKAIANFEHRLKK